MENSPNIVNEKIKIYNTIAQIMQDNHLTMESVLEASPIMFASYFNSATEEQILEFLKEFTKQVMIFRTAIKVGAMNMYVSNHKEIEK